MHISIYVGISISICMWLLICISVRKRLGDCPCIDFILEDVSISSPARPYACLLGAATTAAPTTYAPTTVTPTTTAPTTRVPTTAVPTTVAPTTAAPTTPAPTTLPPTTAAPTTAAPTTPAPTTLAPTTAAPTAAGASGRLRPHVCVTIIYIVTCGYVCISLHVYV